MKLIALAGVKRSGKNTAATLLAEILGPARVEERALANLLKVVTCEIFNLDPKYVTDQDLKEKMLDESLILDDSKLKAFYTAFGLPDQDPRATENRVHLGRTFLTPRQALQYLGSEVLHPIDPLIHAKLVLKPETDKIVVVTDMRFVAEFNFLSSQIAPQDFLPLFIHNNEAEFVAKTDLHPSEQQVFTFSAKCVMIDNNARHLDNLADALRQALKVKEWL